MTTAQRKVLSGTFFVLGTLGVLVFVLMCWPFTDVHVRPVVGVIIFFGVPTVVLFAAGLYVRAWEGWGAFRRALSPPVCTKTDEKRLRSEVRGRWRGHRLPSARLHARDRGLSSDT